VRPERRGISGERGRKDVATGPLADNGGITFGGLPAHVGRHAWLSLAILNVRFPVSGLPYNFTFGELCGNHIIICSHDASTRNTGIGNGD